MRVNGVCCQYCSGSIAVRAGQLLQRNDSLDAQRRTAPAIDRLARAKALEDRVVVGVVLLAVDRHVGREIRHRPRGIGPFSRLSSLVDLGVAVHHHRNLIASFSETEISFALFTTLS